MAYQPTQDAHIKTSLERLERFFFAVDIKHS